MNIFCGDTLTILREHFADESVQCVVTSPPYWGLRDYGTAQWEGGRADCDHTGVARRCDLPGRNDKQSTQKGSSSDRVSRECLHCGATRLDAQLGLEPTPEAYVAKMVEIFRDVRRVLKNDGTLWLNLGDSYAGSWGNYHPNSPPGKHGQRLKETARWNRPAYESQEFLPPTANIKNLKPKDLVGIPWRVAFALQQPYYSGRIKKLEDRIWLAAMIEAEGCMFLHKRKEGQSNGQGYKRQNDSYGAGLEVANTHRAIVERCLEIAQQGSICSQSPQQNDRRKQTIYRWNLRNNDCREIIKEVYPYLIGKQQQARLLIGCPSSGERAEAAHAGLIALHRGSTTEIDFPPPPSCFEPGYYLRSDIIWSKCNPMPESVTDRPTKAHEYLFLLSKSERYFYDAEAIQEPAKYGDPRKPFCPGQVDSRGNGHDRGGGTVRKSVKRGGFNGKTNEMKGREAFRSIEDYRNKRSVWEIATQPYREAHFATFPEKLVEPCILAGSKPGDVILDPFCGSGTTLAIAKKFGRMGVGIELNPEYVNLAYERIGQVSEALPL